MLLDKAFGNNCFFICVNLCVSGAWGRGGGGGGGGGANFCTIKFKIEPFPLVTFPFTVIDISNFPIYCN